MRYQNRRDAGRQLAARLAEYAARPDVRVLGLPRGGVPVAYEIARALDAPLDVYLVRKLGVPGREELAMGAIASGDIRVLNEDVIGGLEIAADVIETVTAEETRELRRREGAFRGNRPPVDVAGKVVILVDDGLATGSTMRAAVASLRCKAPARIIVAVPVGAAETCREFLSEADEIFCGQTPDPFYAVGLWYEDFSQTTDAEVHDLLQAATTPRPAAIPKSNPNVQPHA